MPSTFPAHFRSRLRSRGEEQPAKGSRKPAILTGAHSDLAVGRGAEVAEEPLVGIAGVPLGAQLAQLLGAHPAAPAAVLHQAHSGRALGRRGGALALPAAVLAGHLLGTERGAELGGGSRASGAGEATVYGKGQKRAAPTLIPLPRSREAERPSVAAAGYLRGYRGRRGAPPRHKRGCGVPFW